MFIYSTFVVVFLNIFGLVLTNPIQEISFNEKPENISIDQTFRNAEKILHRYYYLIDSDADHLVHGMLHVLTNNPTLFPYIPYRAMNIALKNVERKVGHDDMEGLTKHFLLAIDQNYLSKPKQTSPVKLTEEVKAKIEEALDKFLAEEEEEAEFDSHL